MENFIFLANRHKRELSQAVTICLQDSNEDTPGLTRIAQVVCRDIQAVCGGEICPKVTYVPENVGEDVLAEIVDMCHQIPGNLLIAGTLGKHAWIDQLVQCGKIDAQQIEGKRECFLWHVISVEERPVLIVAGSDRLGTIYGLLELSRKLGVSPWCYWADVRPAQRETAQLALEELEFVSREPSVKLRGFFMNDEWPSLGNWVMNTFGDFNSDFYEQVFILLLRLRGNFLWPAMWSASFPIDGGKGDLLGNMKLADELGIVMGTSHHEPMLRASEEWDKVKTVENNVGYGKDWNYQANPQGLHRYWEDSIVERKNFRSLITLGMRGERDTKVMGEEATLGDNIELLKDVIRDQKQILQQHGLSDAPQVLALYKEVEDYYYGDETTPGLAEWDVLDDVMLLLSDDNFGNLRTVPSKSSHHKGGWGLYYHFDYHGAPVSYEWVNSTPIIKVWEQMSQAYEYGIRDLWVVNVGDLRPQELPLSFFMDMAYDFDKWGSKATPQQVWNYELYWTYQQFGAWADEDQLRKIAKVLHRYTKMNGNRRPETVYENTFSVDREQEAERELSLARRIQDVCEGMFAFVPEEDFAAFYSLVYFPAVASANVRKMMIYAGFYEKYKAMGGEYGRQQANRYHEHVQRAIARDQELTRIYNEDMAQGKWRGMMSSAHVGFHNWNDEGWAYPETKAIPAGALAEPNSISGKSQTVATEAKGDVIVLEASSTQQMHNTARMQWLVIRDYGKTKDSIKTVPVTEHAESLEDAPCAVYSFDITAPGDYQIILYFSPTNPLEKGGTQYFGLRVDGAPALYKGTPQEIIDSLPKDFAAGDYNDYRWCQGVLDNIRKVRLTAELAVGTHEIYYYGLDAGVLLQKIEVAKEDAGTYYGYATGKKYI